MFSFKKKYLVILIVIFVLIFFGLWNIVSEGYDKQDKTILFLKKIIPTKLARKIRDTVFIIPELKEKNKFLNLQVKKYEQGLDGNLFEEEIIISKKNKTKYLLKKFFLPFPRLDIRLGWAATENSKRAHYLEIVGDKVFAISGLGQTIFFDKKNIFKKKLIQKNIPNNINNLLAENNFELIGIRDLYVENEKVYISLQHKDELKGFTINIYRADLNFKKLNFEIFFKTNEYWPEYNVFSGGRIEKFKNNKILFSIGYSYVDKVAQRKDSLLGKIVSIDKDTKEFNLISMGHRNPQGLFYYEDLDLIINTEHGPKGGDEINFNFQKNKTIPNYGWDIASYGIAYDGTNPYKKPHSKYDFIEPLKYYVPSIGISEIAYLSENFSFDRKKYLFISSLRAASIFVIQINDELDKIIDEDRIYFPNERIRDIEYDKENNVFFILFEFTPSIGILKIKP